MAILCFIMSAMWFFIGCFGGEDIHTLIGAVLFVGGGIIQKLEAR